MVLMVLMVPVVPEVPVVPVVLVLMLALVAGCYLRYVVALALEELMVGRTVGLTVEVHLRLVALFLLPLEPPLRRMLRQLWRPPSARARSRTRGPRSRLSWLRRQ
jgi:hypothetical protein